MALPILDGNQSLTSLQTIVSAGAHIPAHTIVSFGSQAITDIASAVSGSSINVLTMPPISVTATVSGGLTNTELRATPVTIGGTVTANIGGTPSVTGSISVLNFPSTQTVTFTQIATHGVTIAAGTAQIGSVTASISGTVPVSGTFYQVTQPVSIASLPALAAGTNQIGSVTASISGTPTVTGSVSVLNFPATQTVTFTQIATHGVTIAAGTAQIGSVTASISGTVPVSGTFYQATQPVSIASLPSLAAGTAQIGSVTASISGTPSVTGSVSILNFPATQTVTFTQIATHGVTIGAGVAQIGSVTASISGTPSVTFGTAAITGSVLISNFPSIQAVTIGSGTAQIGSVTANISNSVTIGSLPAISGTVTASLANVVGAEPISSEPAVRVTGAPGQGVLLEGLTYNGSNNVLQGGAIPICGPNYNPVTISGSVSVGNNVTIGSLPAISGTVTANAVGIDWSGNRLSIPVETDSNSISDKFIPIGFNNDGDGRQVSKGYPLPVSGNYVGTNNAAALTEAVAIGFNSDEGTFISAGILNPVPVNINANAVVPQIYGTVTVGNSVTIGSLPTISGTVTANNPNGALTTNFGSVTTANTAQITTAVTNSTRKYLLAQNISTGTVTIGIGFSPTTTRGIQLTAGAGLTFDSFVPTGAVYWLGATTGAAYTILEG